jgi:hypothetical protein
MKSIIHRLMQMFPAFPELFALGLNAGFGQTGEKSTDANTPSPSLRTPPLLMGSADNGRTDPARGWNRNRVDHLK